MVRLSTLAVSTLVPALKVLSTTLPDRTALSLVRTRAGHLPGLTCWNSTTDQSWLPMLRTMPFLRSFVEATRESLSYDGRQALPGSLPASALLPVRGLQGSPTILAAAGGLSRTAVSGCWPQVRRRLTGTRAAHPETGLRQTVSARRASR